MRLAEDLKTRPRLGEVAAIATLLLVANEVFEVEANSDAIITSGMDGKHMQNSKHYVGRAFDFRTKHLKEVEVDSIVAGIKMRLGPDFDVIDEGTHIHVEWDPKA
jgi:hypothetical protein